LRYLSFELSEDTDGVSTIDAEAATEASQLALVAAVEAEVQQVLDWAWRTFPHTHGPVEQGFDWDHDVQHTLVRSGDGHGWHTTALTLSASAAFAEAFAQRFGEALN
jgi:hypothetical protein